MSWRARAGVAPIPSLILALGVAMHAGCFYHLPDHAVPGDGGADATADAAADGPRTSYAAEVLADSPLAYFHFDETTGTVAVDTTSSHPGTYEGSPTLGVPGLLAGPGTAVQFDGDDDVMRTAANPTAGDFTVEAIILASVLPATYRRGLFCAEEYEVSGFRFGISENGELVFWTSESGGSGTVSSAPGRIVAGKRVHVAATHSNGTVTLYADGVVVAAAPVSVRAAKGPVAVGATMSSQYFTGIIDEPAIYARALPAERVAAHAWAAGLGP